MNGDYRKTSSNRGLLSMVFLLIFACGAALAKDDDGVPVASTAYDPNNPVHVAAAERMGGPQNNGKGYVSLFGEGVREFDSQQAADAYAARRMQAEKDKAQATVNRGEASITWNGEFLQPQSQAASQVSGSSGPVVGMALMPTPKTASGGTIGLSGVPALPSDVIINGIPDGYLLVNGNLVKETSGQNINAQENNEATKDVWPADRIEKSHQDIAVGLAKYKQQAQTEGRKISADEGFLVAARLEVENRVYTNPKYKPTLAEQEAEALRVVEEWKRDNIYMMADGTTRAFGPDSGPGGWGQGEGEAREAAEKAKNEAWIEEQMNKFKSEFEGRAHGGSIQLADGRIVPLSGDIQVSLDGKATMADGKYFLLTDRGVVESTRQATAEHMRGGYVISSPEKSVIYMPDGEIITTTATSSTRTKGPPLDGATPTIGTTLNPTPRTLQGTPVGLSGFDSPTPTVEKKKPAVAVEATKAPNLQKTRALVSLESR